MRRIDWYIARHIFSSVLLVLMVLVGLFAFFTFIEEVKDIGKANYDIWSAIQYVGLTLPLFIYELFPSAALLGGLLGLGTLANHHELTVIRASGVSTLRLAWSVTQIGLLLTIVVMLIGETLAPLGERTADNLRKAAQTQGNGQQRIFQTRYGFWARDGNAFVNIRTILPDGGFGDITLYEFSAPHQLSKHTLARRAYYNLAGFWELQDVRQTTFSHDRVQQKHLPRLQWQAILNPDLIKTVVVQPHKLSSWGLYQYINYLRQSEQRTTQYELAFWNRISYPLVSLTMLLLAMPLVFGSMRSVSIGQRIVMGALLGIGFYMLNQTVGNVGLVYELSPLLSAFAPALIFLLLALGLMRRFV